MVDKFEMAMDIIKAWSVMGFILSLISICVGIAMDRTKWKDEVKKGCLVWLIAIGMISVICVGLVW